MKLDLSAIRQRLDDATPGPWFVDGLEVRHDCSPYTTENGISDCTVQICQVYRITQTLDPNKNDREFIANAPTDIKALLDEVTSLEAKLAIAVKELKECVEDRHYDGCYPRHTKALNEIEKL